MAISITLGWWLLPLVVTVVSFAWALPFREDEKPTGSMFDGLAGIGMLFRAAGAAIGSLFAWLIWALVT